MTIGQMLLKLQISIPGVRRIQDIAILLQLLTDLQEHVSPGELIIGMSGLCSRLLMPG